jgi:hypothetical protein
VLQRDKEENREKKPHQSTNYSIKANILVKITIVVVVATAIAGVVVVAVIASRYLYPFGKFL